jgi:hypothetical protein
LGTVSVRNEGMSEQKGKRENKDTRTRRIMAEIDRLFALLPEDKPTGYGYSIIGGRKVYDKRARFFQYSI